MVNGAIAEACKLKKYIYIHTPVNTETRTYNDLIYDKMTADKEYAIQSHLKTLHIQHTIDNNLLHEFYKHSFGYVRICSTWNNTVPYNCSFIADICFWPVTFNYWKMKIFTLPGKMTVDFGISLEINPKYTRNFTFTNTEHELTYHIHIDI